MSDQRKLSKIAPSILCKDLQVIGQITSTGDIQIDGILDGDLRSHAVTVGQDAHILASWRAKPLPFAGVSMAPFARDRCICAPHAKLMAIFITKPWPLKPARISTARSSAKKTRSKTPLSVCCWKMATRTSRHNSPIKHDQLIQIFDGCRLTAHPLGKRGFHERVKRTIQHAARIATFNAGSQILDHLIGLQNIRAYLVAPANL